MLRMRLGSGGRLIQHPKGKYARRLLAVSNLPTSRLRLSAARATGPWKVYRLCPEEHRPPPGRLRFATSRCVPRLTSLPRRIDQHRPNHRSRHRCLARNPQARTITPPRPRSRVPRLDRPSPRQPAGDPLCVSPFIGRFECEGINRAASHPHSFFRSKGNLGKTL